jgi:hypothetical protein
MGFVATPMHDDLRQESRTVGSKPFDISVLDEWAVYVRNQGWAASSVERALKRLRAFTRATPGGLFRATRVDVVRFAERQAHREAVRSGRPADFNAYVRGEG